MGTNVVILLMLCSFVLGALFWDVVMQVRRRLRRRRRSRSGWSNYFE